MAESTRMQADLHSPPKTHPHHLLPNTLKRKRLPSSSSSSLLCDFTPDQKASQIQALDAELQGLFGYYTQVLQNKPHFVTDSSFTGNDTSALNGMVAIFMEESQLPLSKLVEQICAKLSDFNHHHNNNNTTVTPALVKTAVLFVGQRVPYGVPNADADVLEDDTPASLWCWETRDLKLVPKSVRGELKIRRLCRKKIHERISAASVMVAALQKSETDQSYQFDLTKASQKLSKVLQEADIRSLVDNMLQKNGAEMTEKEAKREQKLLIKQMEKNKREVEKEKRRMDLELQKEKKQTEREHKRLLEEAEKDEKRREKEESEMKRQLKKQQEVEKEQRRKEKEEAELKRQSAIKKQASIMERFLKRSKSISPCPKDETPTKATTSDTVSNQSMKMPEAVTHAMDCALSSNDDVEIDNIRKFHLSSWRNLGHTVQSNRKQHWSIRWKPKTELYKKLKLTANRELSHDDDLIVENLVNEWEEVPSDDRSCVANLESSDAKKCKRRKQLLQFDKSHRPAFYGIWPKKSVVVGPRHPFRKEPDLDYDVDSDEEWEEEDPGESLSDCDKDVEEQSLEDECSKDDEESEDGFFVPDGYLSENEGVQVDRMETDLLVEESRGAPNCKQDLESEEFHTLLQQQKYLNNLTENALRKNQPLIISNLLHEKDFLLVAEDLTGTSKLEKMCLEALSICSFPGGLPVEISMVSTEDDDQDACLSSGKTSNIHISTVTTLQESDMPTIVSAVQSCSQSINKVVESLQQKFPTVSKSQLRNKVREISDFVDNRWQVKKEILDKVGASSSPEKSGGRMQNISKFFSKRCLPPAGKSMNPSETSPEPSRKSGVL